MAQIVSIGPRPVYNSETITVSSTAIGPTASKLQKAAADNFPSEQLQVKSAYVTVETASIRVAFDSAVTVTASTNGHVFQAGDAFTVDGYDAIARLKMIRVTSTDATVRVTYFG